MADLELPLLSPEDIYGGKLVAAMDRQHPRDLFDVMELFAHGGITPEIRRAFVVYLASHNRTIHEVLFPTPKDIRLAYEGSFVGMTTEPVTLEALLETRERLFRELPAALDANEREFLRTLVRAEPDWSLLGIPHLEELPAIRWRLQNLRTVVAQPARTDSAPWPMLWTSAFSGEATPRDVFDCDSQPCQVSTGQRSHATQALRPSGYLLAFFLPFRRHNSPQFPAPRSASPQVGKSLSPLD